MSWNKENKIWTKDKINLQRYKTRVLMCQQVLGLELKSSYLCCIDCVCIALLLSLLLPLIFVMNILPCYFPEQLVKTVEVRFKFPRQYKPVYDDLDAKETKEFTTQIVNAVSLIFVHIFIPWNFIFTWLSFSVKTVAVQDLLLNGVYM